MDSKYFGKYLLYLVLFHSGTFNQIKLPNQVFGRFVEVCTIKFPVTISHK